jgi:translocation and assembly module TamB
MPDWQEASAELNVDSAEIAAFTSYLPLLLAPQGRIDLNLRLESGSLDGRLELHDAATRPVPPMGPLRAIEARMQFSEQEAEIEEFRAELGGQPVRMDGTVTFAGTGLPEFNLKLQGTNVPLARQPGLVLRSDLDLRVARANGEPALISGALGLRHSLFLQDITALKPGGLAEPSRRPPYFSVDQDPFSTWRLDLKITGQEFLRVRSPLFKGSISANLELRGTLEEPSALGEVRIDEGQIQFPFATLAVDQGTINLSSDNPYEPQLFITASGRNYGYEIRMEIEGSASEPSVVFSSNPPLNSEDIVLMLTAGEVPTSEFTFSNQQKASRLAMFFGRNPLTRLGADEATAERLSIRSGEHISETGKLTYHLEYELTDRWSLVGEYDRFNALNAGLKWRVYSK